MAGDVSRDLPSLSPPSADALISVVTPTYNREGTLPKLFETLVEQGDNNVEWVIVDDGSTDGSKVLIEGYQKAAKFPIRYVEQANAGRYAALNRGFGMAEGGFIWGMDSDDWFPPRALENFRKAWGALSDEQRKGCAGVTGTGLTPEGELIGQAFPTSPFFVRPLSLLAKHKITGDKKEVIRRDILSQHEFPAFDGERRVATSLLLIRIGKDYKFCCINEPFVVKDYLADGLSKNIDRVRMKSPNASRLAYQERVLATRFFAPAFLFKMCVNFARFSRHAGVGFGQQFREIGFRPTFLAAAPIGFLLAKRDQKRNPTVRAKQQPSS